MVFSGRSFATPQARKRRVSSSFFTTIGPQLKRGATLHTGPTLRSDSGIVYASPNASHADCVTPPQQALKYALKIFSLPAGPCATTTPAVSSTASTALADSDARPP